MTRRTSSAWATAVLVLAGCGPEPFTLTDASASSRRNGQFSWASLERGAAVRGTFAPPVRRSVESIELWFNQLVDVDASTDGVILEDESGAEVPAVLEWRGDEGMAVTFDSQPGPGVTWQLRVTPDVVSWFGEALPFEVTLSMPIAGSAPQK